MKVENQQNLDELRQAGLKKLFSPVVRISVGMGTCGIGNGAQKVYQALEKELKKHKVKVYLTSVGCFGSCAIEPLVNVAMSGKPVVIFSKVTPGQAKKIVDGIIKGEFKNIEPYCKIEAWDHITSYLEYGKGFPSVSPWDEIPFFKGQKKIVLRDCGIINPEDIQEYAGVGGYQALFNALRSSPQSIIDEVKKSNLRGRGGAGFPVWRKWEILSKQPQAERYLICNADEGDPGAYMNRNEIESDPHMILEGMIIGGFATGAQKGIIYCRAEYPLAVKRLKNAILQAREYGFLGKNICGSSFYFDLEVVEGAGAFVCGEETALIASIEGKAGRPRPRPPFPAQKGLWDKPTNINNVETWCNVPVIAAKGGEWLTKTGTSSSSGTKVFSLVGKIKNTGLVELPFGTPLQKIIYDIGGGTGTKKHVKAVQTGGPSGGCIPASMFNTVVDYETLAACGAILGSGGMVVMDEDNCMVDVARYFTEFTTSESCGKCTPCREGLSQALAILNKISGGQGMMEDLEILENLAKIIADTALCGLGQTAPNPILTTIKYFRREYEEHIKEKKCDAGVCGDMFISPCENSCPLNMNIPGYLELLKENRMPESFKLILEENPLPASIGRICHFHCKMRCRREDIDEPVMQGEVHRYIADDMYAKGKEKSIYAKLIKEKLGPSGKKISIIGAGPAGLSAAYFLIRLGHEVTVYESRKVIGGILAWGIPAYRLPRHVLAKEIDFIKKLGVKFVLAKKIGPDDFKNIKAGSDEVILAIGAYKEISLKIEGEELSGVISGVDFLENTALGKKQKLGKKVIVIGGGNVAIDAARSALRLGADVTVAYRRGQEDMPANIHEIEDALAEGIKFTFYAAPEKILSLDNKTVSGLRLMKMKPGDSDASGRPKSLPTGEAFDISTDTLMLAIGERVDGDYLKACGLDVNKDNTVKSDYFTLKTNDPKVYVCGDMVCGPGTAVQAMALAKKAVIAIDKDLTGQDRFDKLYKHYDYSNKVELKPSKAKKPLIKTLPIKTRICNFKEVSCGLASSQAHLELKRCLRCDVKCGK